MTEIYNLKARLSITDRRNIAEYVCDLKRKAALKELELLKTGLAVDAYAAIYSISERKLMKTAPEEAFYTRQLAPDPLPYKQYLGEYRMFVRDVMRRPTICKIAHPALHERLVSYQKKCGEIEKTYDTAKQELYVFLLAFKTWDDVEKNWSALWVSIKFLAPLVQTKNTSLIIPEVELNLKFGLPTDVPLK